MSLSVGTPKKGICGFILKSLNLNYNNPPFSFLSSAAIIATVYMWGAPPF